KIASCSGVGCNDAMPVLSIKGVPTPGRGLSVVPITGGSRLSGQGPHLIVLAAITQPKRALSAGDRCQWRSEMVARPSIHRAQVVADAGLLPGLPQSVQPLDRLAVFPPPRAPAKDAGFCPADGA